MGKVITELYEPLYDGETFFEADDLVPQNTKIEPAEPAPAPEKDITGRVKVVGEKQGSPEEEGNNTREEGMVRWRGIVVPQAVGTNYPYNLVGDNDARGANIKIKLPQDKMALFKDVVKAIGKVSGIPASDVIYHSRYQRVKGTIYMIFLVVPYNAGMGNQITKSVNQPLEGFQFFGKPSNVEPDQHLYDLIRGQISKEELKQLKNSPQEYARMQKQARSMGQTYKNMGNEKDQRLVVAFTQDVVAKKADNSPTVKLTDYSEFEAYLGATFPTDIASLKNKLVDINDKRIAGGIPMLKAEDEDGDVEVFKVSPKSGGVYSDWQNENKFAGKKKVVVFSKIKPDEFAKQTKELTGQTIRVPKETEITGAKLANKAQAGKAV